MAPIEGLHCLENWRHIFSAIRRNKSATCHQSGVDIFSGIFSMATICLYHVKTHPENFWKPIQHDSLSEWLASVENQFYCIRFLCKPFFLRLDWTRWFHVSLSIIPDALKDFFPYVLSEKRKKHYICFVVIYPRMGIMIYNLCINSCYSNGFMTNPPNTGLQSNFWPGHIYIPLPIQPLHSSAKASSLGFLWSKIINMELWMTLTSRTKDIIMSTWRLEPITYEYRTL